ncbi:MAG: ATP-grasp domain-containing protein [Acidobacteriota bacterium]|jgi:carbamoyl-phosphate synthase large subunit|nr:ATP-grasp domain-containing protein [Acidobacteriota bacterium]
MKVILVSGASGIVGYGILNCLRESADPYVLIGTTISSRSVAPAFCDIVEIVPKTISKDYLSCLYNIVTRHKVDMIVPGIEDDMFFWNRHRDEFSRLGVFPLLNNASLIDLCADKWKFYERLRLSDANNYAIPTFRADDFAALPIPFLLKPIHGYGSKGIVTIDNRESFEWHTRKNPNAYIMQPIVGSDDEEYSVSAFFDEDSVLLDALALKRRLSQTGFTESAETVFRDDIEVAIRRLADVFKPIGPTNFQFRMTCDGLKLLEINPRISSATSIRAKFGYNENVMSVEYFLNKKIPGKSEKRSGWVVRYTTDKVFYDSDII